MNIIKCNISSESKRKRFVTIVWTGVDSHAERINTDNDFILKQMLENSF